MPIEEMKKRIEAWFKERGLDSMNVLQGQLGLISDNAINFDDVAHHDIRLCHYFIFSGEMEKLLAAQS